MVVPAGEQTASFSTAGCPPASTSSAAPFSVCAAKTSACARGIPKRTAASAIASINTKPNAGPEPETPVTASIRLSGTISVRPEAESKSHTAPVFSGGTSAPAETAVMPQPQDAATLGIMRTTGLPRRAARTDAVGTPAAMETTVQDGCSQPEISASSAGSTAGFTAKKRKPARSAASRLETAVQPQDAANARAFSSSASETSTFSAPPRRTTARIKALPIAPVPIQLIVPNASAAMFLLL